MRKKDIKFPIIIGISIIFVIVGIIITINANKEEDYSKMTEEERTAAINEKIDKVDLTTLKEMTEKERMERYVGKFIELLQNEKYEDAYALLNKDFRDRFFKTVNSFKEYTESKFSSRISVEYTNIERNGDIYILWVNIGNPLRSKSEAKEMNFIVKENALNDY